MQLSRIILNVASPRKLATFYVDQLGMTARTEGESTVLSFPGEAASLELRKAARGTAYIHQRHDRYWKIGITLPNVDIAHQQLCAAGIEVSEPHQFRDIGYMCHLSDPEGFSIELLQHHFESNRPVGLGDKDQLLGGGARIGQVTLRTTDIDASLAFYRGRLGMTLLSVQPVETHGFMLYFLAHTKEEPPNSDLMAIENREWLWQRPYTTLEFQHLKEVEHPVHLNRADSVGFAGLQLSGVGQADHLEDEVGGSIFVSS